MQNCCLWTHDETRMVAHHSCVMAKPKTSQQKQKHHGKTKNLTAKTKYLTAKPKPQGKNKIPHGKTENLTAKTKTSRQNQILHSKNQIPHGKSKYPRQNQSYFVFAVKYLVLPWGFWFCREVFCFCREVFGFAVTVVGHHRPPLAPPPPRCLEESNFQNRSTVLYVNYFTFHLLLAYIVLWYRKIKNWRKNPK